MIKQKKVKEKKILKNLNTNIFDRQYRINHGKLPSPSLHPQCNNICLILGEIE